MAKSFEKSCDYCGEDILMVLNDRWMAYDLEGGQHFCIAKGGQMASASGAIPRALPVRANPMLMNRPAYVPTIHQSNKSNRIFWVIVLLIFLWIVIRYISDWWS